MSLQKLLGKKKALKFLQSLYDETITLFHVHADQYGGKLRSAEDEKRDKELGTEFGSTDLVSAFKGDEAKVFIGYTDYGAQYDEIDVLAPAPPGKRFDIGIKFGWTADSQVLEYKLAEINEFMPHVSGLTQGLKLRLNALYSSFNKYEQNLFRFHVYDVRFMIAGTTVEDIAPMIRFDARLTTTYK